MNRTEQVERLAKWLNDVCVDWPPLSYQWDADPSRRAQMRSLARKALDRLNGDDVLK